MTRVLPSRKLEQMFWDQRLQLVAGVDEVGRGPLAGPVTVAAVILPRQCDLPQVRDSKLMTPTQRRTTATMIKRIATAVGIGWTSNREIDELGLTAATRLAGQRALRPIVGCEQVLLDGNFNYLGDEIPVHVSIKADQHCLAVAAASVIAKVARDSYMELLGEAYPQYGFAHHKGYAAPAHLAALLEYGPTPHHRYSYRPVREVARVYV